MGPVSSLWELSMVPPCMLKYGAPLIITVCLKFLSEKGEGTI